MKTTPSSRKILDKTEKMARFGCGALTGVILVFGLGLVSTSTSFAVLFVSIAIPALICGLLAIRFGNQFWQWCNQFLRW